MIVRRTERFAREAWNGVLGSDARYYARRSDGACFAIDGAVRVLDLASPDQSPHVRAVASLPQKGRYALRVFAASGRDPEGVGSTDPAAPRLLAYGVRRIG